MLMMRMVVSKHSCRPTLASWVSISALVSLVTDLSKSCILTFRFVLLQSQINSVSNAPSLPERESLQPGQGGNQIELFLRFKGIRF